MSIADTSILCVLIIMTIPLISPLLAFPFHNLISPLTSLSSQRNHDNDDMDYGPCKKNHPTFYDDSPPFRGPLVIPHRSISNPRQRIRHYIEQAAAMNTNSTQYQNWLSSSPKIVRPQASTQEILQTIVHALIYHDAPIDIKEVAESTEFLLRTKKRFIHSAKQQIIPDSTNIHLHLYDICSGHGLTGLLFAASLFSTQWVEHTFDSLHVTMVDSQNSQIFSKLQSLIQYYCPWMRQVSIQFLPQSLEKFTQSWNVTMHQTNLVVATHACGSLTDQVIRWAIQDAHASGIAIMPCCYTGTDQGMPYGLQRALGVGWNADIRRALYMQECGYHVDLGCIPRQITPMNRILIGELKRV